MSDLDDLTDLEVTMVAMVAVVLEDLTDLVSVFSGRVIWVLPPLPGMVDQCRIYQAMMRAESKRFEVSPA